MSDKKKVQGEGDYESARNFRKQSERSVREHQHGDKPARGDPEKASRKPTAEEREGQSRAKKPEQDKRDARYMDKMERNKDH